VIVRYEPRCPEDGGRLLDWPNDRWGWFCPDQRHGGNGTFLRTDEAMTDGSTMLKRSRPGRRTRSGGA